MNTSSVCSYIQAQATDGCWSLAQRCNITQGQFNQYNSGANICNRTIVGQSVCCSAGPLPDFSPKPYDNGTCYTYTTQSGDTCASIAIANSMSTDKIISMNNGTWGWAGCDLLQLGQTICLSDGTPPFPAPVNGALCGPQVPGTEQPTNISSNKWATLNPCPFNSSCDRRGHCGNSTEFHIPKPFYTGGIGDEDGDDDEKEDFVVCDYGLAFSSLDDLSSKAGGLRTDCISVYTLRVLIDMLNVAYSNYTDVDNGYDDMFGYYVSYITKLVPSILEKNLIWDGSTTGLDTITGQDSTIPKVGPVMSYFDCKLGDGTQIPCSDVSNTYERTMKDNPTDMKMTDEDGYTKALVNAGLAPDWVMLGDYEIDRPLDDAKGADGPTYGGHGIDKVIEEKRGGIRTFPLRFTSAPVKNSSLIVPNPKDVVTKGLGSIEDLHTSMEATMLDIISGNWVGGAMSDAVQAYSIPVFMLLQAVDSMAQAKQLGQQEEQQEEAEEEERKKNFIFLIVSVVLMFVPIIGEEVAAVAGFADIARAIAIAGEVGNDALAIYDIVQDPKSAVVNIFGMLMGVGAIAKVSRDGKGIASVAQIRKDMKPDDISSLGAIFKDNDDKLQRIMKVCKHI
ncbi:hypothetical protein F5B20DRAFT_579808 [Whalleya microplaca]|nr:hypothetical protein F5B20DRAFT_579808 [Whalleya microplaca]